MPAIPLPQFDSLVEGDDYCRPAGPTDDACDTTGASFSQITGAPIKQPSPLQVVSLASVTQDATNISQTFFSGDKGTNWMGNPSYSTTKE